MGIGWDNDCIANYDGENVADDDAAATDEEDWGYDDNYDGENVADDDAAATDHEDWDDDNHYDGEKCNLIKSWICRYIFDRFGVCDSDDCDDRTYLLTTRDW